MCTQQAPGQKECDNALRELEVCMGGLLGLGLREECLGGLVVRGSEGEALGWGGVLREEMSWTRSEGRDILGGSQGKSVLRG